MLFRSYRINGRSDKFDQAKSPLTADGRHRKPNAAHTGCKDVAMNFRNGLSPLLRPEDSVLLLIDHQPYQLANVNSHEPQMDINNTAGLAKAAKAFGDPTLLTNGIAAPGRAEEPTL